ncbi:MAG TPA: thrombospondin type 3 repeat-/CalX-beta domain-containing protein, partial [Candidatus Thalassarchaeaceae archaeon]
NSDLDDDNDSWLDAEEHSCGTDSNNSTSIPEDTDGDRICNILDEDDDGDGVIDAFDAFPLDVNETSDYDLDGIGDNGDDDDDNDNWSDSDEVNCGSEQMDANSTPDDLDMDMICDIMDSDDDNDNYEDSQDDFPRDPNEWSDFDNDGLGDNADLDDDNDNWSDLDEFSCMTESLNYNSTPIDSDSDNL